MSEKLNIRDHKRRLLTILFLLLVFGLLFLISLLLGIEDHYIHFLTKGGLLVGGRALSFLLVKIGCFGALTSTIVFAARAIISGFLTNNMEFNVGAESVASTSDRSEEERDLYLPNNQPAPETLKARCEEELRFLFSLGRERALSEETFQKYINPLSLETASVGFCRNLLERVAELQDEQSRGRVPVRPPFFSKKNKAEEARLYSIMWEYRPRPDQ